MIVAALFVIALQFPTIAFPDLPSPTPIASSTPWQPPKDMIIPIVEAAQYLGEADADVQSLPGQITAPGGVSLLPVDQTGFIFGRAKWLLSINIAEEVFGPFGGFAIPAFAGIAASAVTVVIYVLLFALVFILRFGSWFFDTLVKLIGLIKP